MHANLSIHKRHQHLLKMMSVPLSILLCGSVYAQAPPNDNCNTPTVVPGSAPSTPYFSSVDAADATLDPADPLLTCNTGDDGSQTVWYEYTPSASGLTSINTFGSLNTGGGELDTAHGIFVGSCGALVQVACVDQGLTDELLFEVVAGTTYLIKVGQFAGQNNAGTVDLNVEAPPEPEQFVIESARDGISPNMRDIIAAPSSTSGGNSGSQLQNLVDFMEIPNYTREDTGMSTNAPGNVGSQVAGDKSVGNRGPANILNVFDGGENDDNAFVLATLIAPPDTNGDVGKDHYVQMYNLLTEIFDKDGNTVLGPFPTNAFWAGLGGECEFDNAGDPIVLYDEETDRWLITQFTASFQDAICVAVSTTSDPTGSYYQYEFDFTGIGFPDYPKFGYSTGGINVMVNLFSPYQGPGLGVIDKAEAMVAGPATMVFFTVGVAEFGFIPGDNDGPVFDNTLPTFFTMNGGSGDRVDVFEITPDWATPANSTIAEVAKISVTPFDNDLCNASREACVPQPGSGTGAFPNNIVFLAAISDRFMHRGQTRDFGNRKVAMLNHTVDVDGSGLAGVRWYELENKKDEGWQLKKENTYSPDSNHRWMGSIAMTVSGRTCLGYSLSSQTVHPSIAVAGRHGTSNHMNVPEVIAYDGNVDGWVQTRTVRWGDYSAMAVDPVDDTCWYTQEHAKPNSFIGEQFGWGTKVVHFKVK